MSNPEEEIERLVAAAERERKVRAIGDDAPKRQIELSPSPKENFRWRLRGIARNLRKNLGQSDSGQTTEEIVLDRADAEFLSEALDQTAESSERLETLERLQGRLANAKREFLDRSRDEKVRLSGVARALGWARFDRKRGTTHDMRMVANAYDALRNAEGAVLFENDLASRAGDRAERPEVDPEALRTFEIRQVSPERSEWLVTGCPLEPAQALAAVARVFEFNSPDACHRALETERAAIRRIRDRLGDYVDTQVAAETLQQLPVLEGLARARTR